VHRRLFDSRIRKTSSFGDIAILLILYVQLILGLCTIPVSLNHLDGHEMVKFMSWAQGVLTLQPGASALIADVSIVFKLHLLLGMTIFLLFPFTRLVHIWSAPIWYLGREGYQIVRTKRRGPAAPRRKQKAREVQPAGFPAPRPVPAE
jgi:nitrate reductase gamma subunit